MNLLPFCCIVPTDKLDVVGMLIKPETTASTILTSCAAKLPDASRATMALAVFALVAVVAELDTLPAVEIVANFVSTIAADADTSAFTINDVDKFPDASVCTTPALFNPLIDTTPVADIFIRSVAAVLNDKVFAVAADNPVVVLPVNTNDGAAVVPAGSCNAPVMV